MEKIAKEWLEAILHAAILVIILYFICWPVRIDGDSMEDNFHSGDRVIITRIASYFNLIGRGDIVVCKIEFEGKQESVIKRLVGLPGDRIEIKGGKLFLNGAPQDEPYLTVSGTPGELELVLKEDEYFILGDNRPVSYDSRELGPINRSEIVGRVMVKWFPVGEIKVVGRN